MARLGDRMGLRGRKELVAKRDRRNGVGLSSGLGTWVGGQRPPEGTRLLVGGQELGLKCLRDTPVRGWLEHWVLGWNSGVRGLGWRKREEFLRVVMGTTG